LLQACQACYDIGKGFGTPFISGKDSLYNESPLGPVTPTLLITAVGIIPDVRTAVTMDLKHSGNLIYLVGRTLPELGGSEYYGLLGFLGKTVPRVEIKQAKKVVDSVVKAIEAGFVKACHDLSGGGLAVAAGEMAFTGNLGIDLRLKDVPKPQSLTRNDFILFSESNSRFLVEVDKKRNEDFDELMRGNPCALIGAVKKDPTFNVHGVKDKKLVEADLATLRKAWKTPLGASRYEC